MESSNSKPLCVKVTAINGLISLGVPANVGMQQGGVAYWAHAGGFVFGAILGPLLGLFSRPSPGRYNEYWQ
ncbi:hypothetical protein [Planktothrix sp.]|uniref:hypothetical protein n=1 Tax=Planktothrix sp. TaxID=3088171 RepID=UPI0038D50EF8